VKYWHVMSLLSRSYEIELDLFRASIDISGLLVVSCGHMARTKKPATTVVKLRLPLTSYLELRALAEAERRSQHNFTLKLVLDGIDRAKELRSVKAGIK